jgi:hypothetical protein
MGFSGEMRIDCAHHDVVGALQDKTSDWCRLAA